MLFPVVRGRLLPKMVLPVVDAIRASWRDLRQQRLNEFRFFFTEINVRFECEMIEMAIEDSIGIVLEHDLEAYLAGVSR